MIAVVRNGLEGNLMVFISGCGPHSPEDCAV